MASQKLSMDMHGFTFETVELGPLRYCGCCRVVFEEGEFAAPFGGYDLCEGCVEEYLEDKDDRRYEDVFARARLASTEREVY